MWGFLVRLWLWLTGQKSKNRLLENGAERTLQGGTIRELE